jgi:phage shock protein C
VVEHVLAKDETGVRFSLPAQFIILSLYTVQLLFKNYMKKLYRSENNIILSGVLGGIGEYLELDPVVVRIVFLVLTCFTAFFPGVLFYIVALFVIPKRPTIVTTAHSQKTVESTETPVSHTTETTTTIEEK